MKINEKGQAMVEYVLITVFIGFAAIGVFAMFRYALSGHYLKTTRLIASFIP